MSVPADHVVGRPQSVGNFVEDSGALVIRDQAMTHHAILVTDIEPKPRPAVFEEAALLHRDVPREHNLRSPSLPGPVKAFGMITSHHAIGDEQVVSAIRGKPHPAVLFKADRKSTRLNSSH